MSTTKCVKILARCRKRSTATRVPHVITEIPQSATGFKMRNERQKQHLLASYYPQPV